MSVEKVYLTSLDSMNSYFEESGFEVVREYLREEKKYRFTIKHPLCPDYSITGFFMYPDKDGLGFNKKSSIMLEFCARLISDFWHEYSQGVSNPIARRPISTTEEAYIKNDIAITHECIRHLRPGIERVIFNNPATIVFWSDGTKSVVKTQNGEAFDPEKGLAMAIAKKGFGNKGNYYNHIKKWTDKYCEERTVKDETVKTDELCTRCKWNFTGDECKSHKHCTDCGHRDKYGRCLCLTVRSFDSCPYFEEATAE